MYKTISINNDTYQNLHAIATRLDKPKSQVIDEMVREYIEQMNEKEQKQLQKFNAFVDDLAKQVKLPEGVRINTTELDKEFHVLKDTDY
jgi:metal-responsive CopG/Arc/MetJ family transcriptional regulator